MVEPPFQLSEGSGSGNDTEYRPDQDEDEEQEAGDSGNCSELVRQLIATEFDAKMDNGKPKVAP
ncbi:hypothetical protein KIPB_013550, partial [Kipferlia bialata]|eukprot:g13550.t1